MSRTGNYVRISGEKRAQMLGMAVLPSKYSSLTAIARELKISKNTVKANLERAVELGQLSENNHLLQRTRQDRVGVNLRLQQRKKLIVDFVKMARMKQIPISINLIQKKFGGEKKFIKTILDVEVKKYSGRAKPFLRRSKSSQSRRKK